MTAIEIPSPILGVLSEGGVIDRACRIQSLARGGNNKTWRVDCLDGHSYVAKLYFRHPDDTRDRLAAEYEFLRYAYALAPGHVPEPIACDDSEGAALFRFVPGHVFRPSDIGGQEVSAAAAFFAAINPRDRFERGALLPVASEACFSIVDHVALVGRRVEKLHEVLVDESTVPDAQKFINLLKCRWDSMKYELLDAAMAYGLEPERPLPRDQHCISPSDFGFHNALRSDSGEVCFLDFEYAGWDDPAKMVGDFFSQLAVPVPVALFDSFVLVALDKFTDAKMLIQRAHLLRSVYQVKWCCIALNVFLPVHLERRKFADPALDERSLKQAQLAKAITLFQSLISPIRHGLH